MYEKAKTDTYTLYTSDDIYFDDFNIDDSLAV